MRDTCRRDMVRRTAYVTGGVASAATVLVSMGCGPAATPTAVPTKPAGRPTTAPAAAAPTTAADDGGRAAASGRRDRARDRRRDDRGRGRDQASRRDRGRLPSRGRRRSPAATGAASPAAAGAAAKPAAKPAPPARPTGATPPADARGRPGPPATPTSARSPLSVKADDPAIEVKKVEFTGEAAVLRLPGPPRRRPGSYAGLIVIHENRGLTEHIHGRGQRAAKEAMIALGVDLVSRGGGTEKVADDARIGGMLGQAKPEDLVADLQRRQVRADPGRDQEGQDRRGRLLLRRRLHLAPGGDEQGDQSATPFVRPDAALELVPNTNAAILGIYAGLDQRINASIPPLEEALKKAGKTYEMKVYPEVNHGFHNDTGAAWNEKAAVDAWQTAMAWHKKNLA